MTSISTKKNCNARSVQLQSICNMTIHLVDFAMVLLCCLDYGWLKLRTDFLSIAMSFGPAIIAPALPLSALFPTRLALMFFIPHLSTRFQCHFVLIPSISPCVIHLRYFFVLAFLKTCRPTLVCRCNKVSKERDYDAVLWCKTGKKCLGYFFFTSI